MIGRLLILAGLAFQLAACGTGVQSGASATTAPTSSAVPAPTLSLAGLKLALIHEFGPLWYCDPDVYPIARGEEIDHARDRWAEVTADPATIEAIRADLDLAPDPDPSDEAKLAVYRAWKVLNAIALDPAGDGSYRFDYLAQPGVGATEGTRTTGTIAATGTIAVESQAPAGEPICPICLVRGTRIETPDGGVGVDVLRIGDAVWTLGAAGHRVVGTVIALGSTPAAAGHHVVTLVLADGRSVTASPGHPLADGRRLGGLRPGDVVGGSPVIEADLIPYSGDATFDLVVSGQNGTYFVDGIALGSTLRP